MGGATVGGHGAPPALGGPAVCLCRPVWVLLPLHLVHPQTDFPKTSHASVCSGPSPSVPCRTKSAAQHSGPLLGALWSLPFPESPLFLLDSPLPRSPPPLSHTRHHWSVSLWSFISSQLTFPFALICWFQSPTCPGRSAPCWLSPH